MHAMLHTTKICFWRRTPQETYYSSRTEALQNVESTIVELGGIFQQLAHMVGIVWVGLLCVSQALQQP